MENASKEGGGGGKVWRGTTRGASQILALHLGMRDASLAAFQIAGLIKLHFSRTSSASRISEGRRCGFLSALALHADSSWFHTVKNKVGDLSCDAAFCALPVPAELI